ncbi:hypothetical protein FJ543_05770 [Mesorhizobium sp. B2-5-7]|nr:hypothetical protein FJ543_05770 [Mesorhizobium sp. B2-5-7]
MAVAVLLLVSRAVRLLPALDDIERGLSQAGNARRIPRRGQRHASDACPAEPHLCGSDRLPAALEPASAGPGADETRRHLHQAFRRLGRFGAPVGVRLFAYLRWLRPAVLLACLANDQLSADRQHGGQPPALRAGLQPWPRLLDARG